MPRKEKMPEINIPNFKNHVPEQVKKERLDILMAEQQKISQAVQERFLGKTLDVLIDEKQKGEEYVYLGRSEFDAPDVDGLVYVRSEKNLHPSDLVSVCISDTYEYDLTGELVT